MNSLRTRARRRSFFIGASIPWLSSAAGAETIVTCLGGGSPKKSSKTKLQLAFGH